MKLRTLMESDRKQDININPENNSESFYRQQLHMSYKFYPQVNTFWYKAHIINYLFLASWVIFLFVVSEKV